MHLVGTYLRRHRHKRVRLIDLEEFSGTLRKHHGCERTERLALLDACVKPVLHLRVTGVRQDGSVAESAGAHLKTTLEPADNTTLGYAPCHKRNELRLLQPLVAEPCLIESAR